MTPPARLSGPAPEPGTGAKGTSPGRDQGTTESEVAARLRLAVTRLSRQLRQQVVGGLTPSQMSALATVERLGAPSLGELAAGEGIRPPSMTRLVESLAGAGLIERVIDADDRRFARVRVTGEGRRTLQRTRSAKTAFLVRRLQRLPAAERRALGDLVSLLEHLVDQP